MRSVPLWIVPACCVATIVASLALLAWADHWFQRGERRNAQRDAGPDRDATISATERATFDRIVSHGYYGGRDD